jgi:hypothetical protein
MKHEKVMIMYLKLRTEKVNLFNYISYMKLLYTARLHIMERVRSLKCIYIMKFFSIDPLEGIKLSVARLSI